MTSSMTSAMTSSISSEQSTTESSFMDRKTKILSSDHRINGIREIADPSCLLCLGLIVLSCYGVAYLASFLEILSVQYLLVYGLVCASFHAGIRWVMHSPEHLSFSQQRRVLIGYAATWLYTVPFYAYYQFGHKTHHYDYFAGARSKDEIMRYELQRIESAPALLLPIPQWLAAKVPLRLALGLCYRLPSEQLCRQHKAGGQLVEGILIQLLGDLLILALLGPKALLFLFISNVYAQVFIKFVNTRVHPLQAGKRISLSHYNKLFNMSTSNLGYHLEHHEVQDVDPRYLPIFKQLAGQFYEDADQPTRKSAFG